MSAKLPAYPWSPTAALSSGRIEELSAAEECWYRRALDRSWDDFGVPADPVKFAKRIGKKCTVKAAEMILSEFFVPYKKDPSKMVNTRQEKDRASLITKNKQKSDAGKLGMAKRWKHNGSSYNTVITATNGHKSPSYEEEIIKEEYKQQKKKSAAVTAIRIPSSFSLTEEMIEWASEECPGLRTITAHENFVEYWTNLTTVKAKKVDWLLTWKKGMKLALEWQLQNDAKSQVGKFEQKECTACNNTRTFPDGQPCEKCDPINFDAWLELKSEEVAA